MLEVTGQLVEPGVEYPELTIRQGDRDGQGSSIADAFGLQWWSTFS